MNKGLYPYLYNVFIILNFPLYFFVARYVEKCRRGLAHRVGEMYFSFKNGKIDEIGELITVAAKLELIERSGNWFKFSEDVVEKLGLTKASFQGKLLKEEMKNNQKMYNYYLNEVRKIWEKVT